MTTYCLLKHRTNNVVCLLKVGTLKECVNSLARSIPDSVSVEQLIALGYRIKPYDKLSLQPLRCEEDEEKLCA